MASVVQQPAVAAPFRHESWSAREWDDRFFFYLFFFLLGCNKRKALPIQKGAFRPPAMVLLAFMEMCDFSSSHTVCATRVETKIDKTFAIT